MWTCWLKRRTYGNDPDETGVHHYQASCPICPTIPMPMNGISGMTAAVSECYSLFSQGNVSLSQKFPALTFPGFHGTVMKNISGGFL